MATQAAGRPSFSGDTFTVIVYTVAFAIGILAILVGVLAPMDPKAKAGFVWLGAWAVASTGVAIIHRSTGQLVVRAQADEFGPRVDVLARLGVEGWAFWTIFALLLVAILGILTT